MVFEKNSKQDRDMTKVKTPIKQKKRNRLGWKIWHLKERKKRKRIHFKRIKNKTRER